MRRQGTTLFEMMCILARSNIATAPIADPTAFTAGEQGRLFEGD